VASIQPSFRPVPQRSTRVRSAPVADTILSLVTAEPGWHALYRGEYEEDSERARVVAWALVEAEDGGREVVGMVIDPNEPTQIVAAPDGASPLAPTFDRYGFRDLEPR
jgi:hypothetical protein